MQRKQKTTDGPPHPGEYDCGCTACDAYRLGRLFTGARVRPVRLDPARYSSQVHSGHTWSVDERPRWSADWSNTVYGLYMGRVKPGHPSYYVKGAYVLIPGLGIRLTQGNKLVTV